MNLFPSATKGILWGKICANVAASYKQKSYMYELLSFSDLVSSLVVWDISAHLLGLLWELN